MSRDFIPEDVYRKVPRHRPMRKKRPTSNDAEIVPPQVTIENGQPRVIRNDRPVTVYLPADPIRRKQLLADIARINRERERGS